MDDWVPFFQTLLWVLLIIGALWRFDAQVRGVLEAVRSRVERGSPVEAGPFKLGESPPAQPEAAQKQELLDEARELAGETSGDTRPPRLDVTRAFLAEELAIRELQAEFGLSINRHVAIGFGVSLDGMFVKPGRAFGIDVKMARTTIDREAVRIAVKGINDAWKAIGGLKHTIILAVVFDREAELAAEHERLEEFAKGIADNVIVRVYSLPELSRKHGIGGVG